MTTDFTPCTPDKAEMIKAVFDDGSILFAASAKKRETENTIK